MFAVKQKPIHNDASVEIASAKNIIIGNENVFNVVVRQAGTDISYRLDVEIDGKSVMSESFIQKEREKVIPVTGAFYKSWFAQNESNDNSEHRRQVQA